jgi:hypothetical protein
MIKQIQEKKETALLWALTQRLLVFPYGHFGTTYPSHLQGSRILGFWTIEDRTDRLSRNVGRELTTTRRVIGQKSAVLVYFAAEA